MAYADSVRVAAIVGIEVADVNSIFLTMADNQVNLITNRTFEVLPVEAIFDIENRNYFYPIGSNTCNFTLDKTPVTSVESVYLSDELLVENEGYWVDLITGMVKFNRESIESIPSGQRKVIINYTFGYVDIPEIIKDFASYLAATVQDSVNSYAKNDDGVPLSEIEIGRYREKYASLDSFLKGKYGSIIEQMKLLIIDKYKLWD